MNVSFCGTSYPSSPGDWKGLFLSNLLFALAAREELRMACWLPSGEIPSAVRRFGRVSDIAFLDGLLHRGGIAQALRKRDWRSLHAPFELLYRLRRAYRGETRFDLHHVNWLQHALALPDDGSPAVVTALGTDMRLLSLPGVPAMLRGVFSSRPTVLCPNAPWMSARLNELFGKVCEIVPVSFGIDERWFRIARCAPESNSIWLVVSRVTKGKIGDLFDWAAPFFRHGSRRLVLIGPKQDELAIPAWVDYQGPASADDLARKWFPAATGIITLSRHPEGRPQLMLEAAASGLPIIASDIQAHLDLEAEGCPLHIVTRPDDLKEALIRLEDLETNHRHGQAMRVWAKETIGTWADCAARYAELYSRLRGLRS